MNILDKIIPLLGGQDHINSLKSMGYEKYGAAGITEVRLRDIVGIDYTTTLHLLPYFTKVFFYEDYYCYKGYYKGRISYGIGIDPDRNEYFKPYEE
jgi:hypothetical protein